MSEIAAAHSLYSRTCWRHLSVQLHVHLTKGSCLIITALLCWLCQRVSSYAGTSRPATCTLTLYKTKNNNNITNTYFHINKLTSLNIRLLYFVLIMFVLGSVNITSLHRHFTNVEALLTNRSRISLSSIPRAAAQARILNQFTHDVWHFDKYHVVN